MTNPTSNYGFVLPTATDLVTDLPADFEVALQGVDTRLKALQPGTTLGDLTYASATANTNTRLPIGTAGQVLSVSGGGVPAWTASADVTPLTTKGDLFTFTTADARLAVGADYGFLQALASESTGLKWNDGAWTSYSPTITAGSGTLTTASATGLYMRIGKTCITQTNWVVTTNGTGAAFIQLTLPFTTSATYIRTGQGREYETTGNMLQIEAPPSDTIMRYRTYANNYPAGNNYKGAGLIIYEVA